MMNKNINNLNNLEITHLRELKNIILLYKTNNIKNNFNIVSKQSSLYYLIISNFEAS